MFDRPKTESSSARPVKRPGILERLALIAGLAVTPKAVASQDEAPRAPMTAVDPSRASGEEAAVQALRARIAGETQPVAEAPSTQVEAPRPSPVDVGRQAVDTLISEGDVQALLANPTGDLDEFSAQAVDDVLSYRDSHLEPGRPPTLAERRAMRQQANDAAVQAVQHRIDDILLGAHGGTIERQQQLAIALSQAFSMMFDENHHTLHTYSISDGMFLDMEPDHTTLDPAALSNNVNDEPEAEIDGGQPAAEEMDPATDDPEDYEEDAEPAPLDPGAAQR